MLWHASLLAMAGELREPAEHRADEEGELPGEFCAAWCGKVLAVQRSLREAQESAPRERALAGEGEVFAHREHTSDERFNGGWQVLDAGPCYPTCVVFEETTGLGCPVLQDERIKR